MIKQSDGSIPCCVSNSFSRLEVAIIKELISECKKNKFVIVLVSINNEKIASYYGVKCFGQLSPGRVDELALVINDSQLG